MKNKLLFMLAPIVAAGLETFVECLLNAGSLDRTTILHALGAAVLVDLALVKRILAEKAKEGVQ